MIEQVKKKKKIYGSIFTQSFCHLKKSSVMEFFVRAGNLCRIQDVTVLMNHFIIIDVVTWGIPIIHKMYPVTLNKYFNLKEKIG